MDRLTQLRGEAGGSQDSTLDTSGAPSEAYITANESSKFFSLSEEDSDFDISPIKDVSLASTADPEKTITGNDQLISNLSPIPKKSDLLDSYKFSKQIEAANILSGGVNIFDDNDNSYDGDELVIDDNVVEIDEKSNPDLKLGENAGLPFQKPEDVSESLESEPTIGSKDTEVVLQIDGNNVNAIDIGNGLYLYRKMGEEELAAVQIISEDPQQPTFKFLKVRENAEGNLEVYEEIEIEVPKEVPVKEGKSTVKTASHVPIKDINKVISDTASTKVTERKKVPPQETTPTTSKGELEELNKISETKSELNLNGKMVKINETRKSPVIHSKPNKEGIPLTKTMVDQQLHPNRHSDNVKTIEVHTITSDSNKQKTNDIQSKSKDATDELNQCIDNKEKEKSIEKTDVSVEFNDQCTYTCEELLTSVKFNSNQKRTENKSADGLKVADSVKVPVNDYDRKFETENTKDKVEEMDRDSTSRSVDEEPSNKKIEVGRKDINDADNKDIIDDVSENNTKHNDETNVVKDKKFDAINVGATGLKLKEINEEVNQRKIDKTNVTNVAKVDETNVAKIDESYMSKVDKVTNVKVHDTDVVIVDKLGVVKVDDSDVTKANETNTVKESEDNILKINEKKTEIKGFEHSHESDHEINSTSGNKNLVPAIEVCGKEAIFAKGIEIQKEKQMLQTDKSETESTDTKVSKDENSPKSLFVAKPDNNKSTSNTETEVRDVIILDEKDKLNSTSLSGDKIFSPDDSCFNSGINRNKDEKNTQNKFVFVSPVNDDSSKEKPLFQEVLKSNESNKIEFSCQVKEPLNDSSKKTFNLKDTLVTKTTVSSTSVKLEETKEETRDIGKKCTAHDIPIMKLDDSKQAGDPESLKKPINLIKSNLKPHEPVKIQHKLEVKPEPTKTATMEQKKINNNHTAVPFGKWTEANRQEFLNKIKESKVPSITSNTKSIKQANDLNRRDVLQKIDSQRQSYSASCKAQEQLKLNLKNETQTFKSSVNRETTVPLKVDAPLLNNKAIILKKVEPVQSQKVELGLSKSVELLPHKKAFKSESLQMPQKTQANISQKSQSTIAQKSQSSIPQKLQSNIPQKSQLNITEKTNIVESTSNTAKETQPKRKEINNQDLIDKTIEGIINRAVSVKQPEPKAQTIIITKTQKDINVLKDKPVTLDAIEMKMNELHGIPFVERPVHELPKVKTYAKSDKSTVANSVNKVPNLLPFTNKSQEKVAKETIIDLDSEDEVIEHEPITGDIDMHKKKIVPKLSATLPISDAALSQRNVDISKKESIITEKDFEKFARRNSITYENCLTVNFEGNKQHNVVQGVVEKETTKTLKTQSPKSEVKTKSPQQKIIHSNSIPNKIQITSKLVPINEDVFNKNYQSKLQQAYQSALTVKRQKESPITIIEDKPVKVVFMESNTDFTSSQLNVQGKELSPAKKHVIELDTVTTSTCDSLDSEVLDAVDDSKALDDTKVKTKHQRKQVLTPVETPELELIHPGDLGIAVSPKKKRRTDDIKADKSAKTVVPKKSYLLGRNVTAEDQMSQKEAANQISSVIAHKDAASAIDSLVKAAELLETQSEISSTNIMTSDTSQTITPVKRGRGRPRKNPLPDGTPSTVNLPSPKKKPRLIDPKSKKQASETDEIDSSDDEMIKENWTMGKINENIVCPICNKLFRSENVVFKHVKHCTGPSPNRSDSDKRSPRRSRSSLDSDSKSMESKADDSDGDSDKPLSKRSTPKNRTSKEISSDNKDVIVIENTPAKEKSDNKYVDPKQQEPRKITKTKAQYKTSLLSCEYCGKTFRQLSYLASHKLLHKKEISGAKDIQESGKSVFCCEVCKKEFRKLHHLVQHRIIHNPSTVSSRPSRKSSSEQSAEHKPTKQMEEKQNDDQSAAFRCEPCDKSFRKLHHLVEHRETHDGINRQRSAPAPVDKAAPQSVPQCDVCKKTFRKLHHLIEHKEQHLETNSEKSDDKSVKSSLSTKDIIHECSLCYMVFPNEHSLTKHTVICQRKKRQSATKQIKESEEVVENEESNKELSNKESENVSTIKEVIDVETSIKLTEKIGTCDTKKEENIVEAKQKRLSKDETTKPIQTDHNQMTTSSKRDSQQLLIETKPEETSEAPQKISNIEDKAQMEVKVSETPKMKITPKKKGIEVKRRKSNLPLATLKETASVESSDDDEIRYMINPDFKEETTEGKVFMTVRAKKRNSLQFERPNSKDLIKRRTSLQHPPKIPRLKSKSVETNNSVQEPSSTKVAKLEPADSIDSDDSDVKYSFPEKSPKSQEPGTIPKEKKKLLTEKRKTLSGIARRKSTGKIATASQKTKTSPEKPIKKRRTEAEHRCDCGQLFSSAALLARHASLAHTPPRVRRPREPPAPPPRRTAPPSRRTAPPAAPPAPPPRRSAPPAPRRSAHRGVPVPESMRKIAERLRRS